MKSANTFYITEGKKQTKLTFHSGGVKKERLPSSEWISRFTIETAENIFRFCIRGDVSFQARDVLEIAPRFVKFRGGKRFDSPVYILEKTEQLPADERTARGLALDRAERTENAATGNNRQTAKNQRATGAKPKYGKKEESIFKRWITYSKSGGTKKDFWNDPKWGLNNSMGLDDLKKLIAGVGRKNNGEYKARHVKRIS